MRKTLARLLNDRSGASAAEYALILSIVGGAIGIASLALGASISQAVGRAATCMETPTSTGCS